MSKYKRIIEIMNRMNSADNYSHLLATIIDSVKQFLNAEGASLLLIDKETDELIFDIVLSNKGEIIRGKRIKFGVGFAGYVAQTGESVISNQPKKDSRFFEEIDIVSGYITRNIIVTPVKNKNKIIGVLEAVNSNYPEGFSEADLVLLEYLADAVGISLANHELVIDLKNRVDELTCIYEISQSIFFTFDIKELLRKILYAVNKVIKAENCSFLILNEKGDGVKYFISTKGENYDIKLENSLMYHVIKTSDPLLVYNVNENKTIIPEKKDIRYKTNSFICVPMKLRDKVIGVLNVTDKISGDIFDSFDLRVLSTVANHVALTYENILLQKLGVEQEFYNNELKIAAQIQNQALSLIPKDIKGCSISAFTIPAQIVGGDFFEINKFYPDLIGVSLGDVSGKGVPAAIFMSNVRAALRYQALQNHKPENLLPSINKLIYKESHRGMFCTLFYCLIDLNQKKLFYSTAGHEEQFVYSIKKNEIISLKTKGKPLGVIDESSFEVREYNFSHEEYLILFSDGLIEQNQKNTVSMSDIKKIINKNKKKDADFVVHEVRKLYEQRLDSNKMDDDLTLIIIKFE